MFDTSLTSGIAIGLQDTSGQLVTIFTAVMSHKALMAFSLGLNMAQSDLSGKSFLVSSIVFSLASPLGVIIGILMSGLPPSLPSDICNGVLQCVAGGTFLYITFFEVLARDKLTKYGMSLSLSLSLSLSCQVWNVWAGWSPGCYPGLRFHGRNSGGGTWTQP